MRNNGSIQGRVVDAAGMPVSGVSVAIQESPHQHQDLAALSNAEGNFRFSGLEPGPYSLAAHRAGQTFGEVHVNVTSGQQVEIEIRING